MTTISEPSHAHQQQQNPTSAEVVAPQALTIHAVRILQSYVYTLESQILMIINELEILIHFIIISEFS